MALVAILKSTFNKLIGRQLSNVVRSLFLFGNDCYCALLLEFCERSSLK